MLEDSSDDDNVIIQQSCELVVKAVACAGRRRKSHSGQRRRNARWRERTSVPKIYAGLGPDYFRRAYRMQYESFWNLHDKLEEGIEQARLEHRGYEKKEGG